MSLDQDSRMSDIGHLGCFCIMIFFGLYLYDASFFPERYLLIEYPLVECEESVCMLFSEKFFLSFCESERLSSWPTYVVELIPIKVIIYFSRIFFARKIIIDCHSQYKKEANTQYER